MGGCVREMERGLGCDKVCASFYQAGSDMSEVLV